MHEYVKNVIKNFVVVFEMVELVVDRGKEWIHHFLHYPFLYYPFPQDIESKHHLPLTVIKLTDKVEVQIDVIYCKKID